MKRTAVLWGMWIAGVLAAAGSTPAELVQEGNEAFEVGSYDEALKLYKKAAKERPESPEIAFDQGAALYRKKDFAGSAQRFAEAAQKAEDPGLRAKAEFNLGNCRFRQSEQDRESGDLQGATKAVKDSVGHFREALRLDPAQREAAENLELARRSLKALMEVQQQQPQQQQSQDPQEDGENQEQQQQQQSQGQEKQDGPEQKPEQSQGSEGKDQQGKDAEQQPGEEKKDQSKAAAEDKEAKKDEKPQPAAAAKDDKEDKGGEKKDEAARAILEEEKENQQRRMKMPLKIKPVEKDW